MVNVTKKEMEFLNKVSQDELAEWVSDEDGWVGTYVSHLDFDMKIARGLMSSLQQKGVINIGDSEILDGCYNNKPVSWVSIETQFLDCDNYKLINIEVA